MAKRTAPSSEPDSSSPHGSSLPSLPSSAPPSASPRITRSAAKLAAEQNDPHQQPQQASAPSPNTASRSLKKRKPARSEPSPDTSPETNTATGPRRSKRPRVAAPDRQQPKSPDSPARTLSNSLVKMSGTSPPGSAAENASTSPGLYAAKQKRSSRGKKVHSDEVPSTPLAGNRRSKGPSKKVEDVDMKEDDATLKGVASRRPDQGVGDDDNFTQKSQERDEERDEDEDEDDEDDGDEEDEDDEDDDDEADDLFRSAFLGGTSRSDLSRTVQALTGMMTGSGTASRLREILESLRAKDDPTRQLIALNELSQLLLVSTEDNLSGHFAPDQFVKELVALMQPSEFGDENSEMMLVACRCIANLMEALPPATPSVVYGGAVPVLCQKLLEINYIDLAEQAISTLEKISVEFGPVIVREGGLTACLTYLDFFPTSTQRVAVTTAANCCRNIPDDSFPVVRDVMPILLNVLSSSDQKVVEQGSLCVSRIVDSFKFQQTKLEELVSPELLRAILRLLLPGTTNLIGPHIHTQFLRVLAITARASPALSAELFKMDVIDTLYQILTGVSPPEDTEDIASKIDGVIIMQALIHRPREQIFETLNVICELLPGISTSGLQVDDRITSLTTATDGLFSAASKARVDANTKRIDLLGGCKDKVKRFVTILLPTLTHAYSSTVNLGVRQKVLTAQLKMLSNLDVSILESALRTVPFSSYLASILSQHDHPTLTIHAILAAEMLLQRIPHVYGYQFFREGVMSEVQKLADRPLTRRDSKDKGKDRSADGGDGSQTLETREASKSTGHKADQNQIFREDISEDNATNEDDMEDDMDEPDIHDDDDDDIDGEDDSHNDLHGDLSPSPSSSSSERHDPEHELASHQEEVVTHQARHLRDVLQNERTQDSRDKAHEILAKAKALAENISSVYLQGTSEDGTTLFKDLARFFTSNPLESITSAELLDSEIVDTLLKVLDDTTCSTSQAARAAFTEVFMNFAVDPTMQGGDVLPASPFSVLVHKLQDLLSRAEHFEVVTVHQNSFSSSRSSAASMLAKQLRLKLVADENSDIPKPFRSIMVSIHAIATFKALDDYLRPRLALSERPRSSRHHDSGLQSSLAALAAATGMPQQQQRFLERGLFGMSDSPSAAASARSGLGLPTSPKQEPSSSTREKTSIPAGSPLSRMPLVADKTTTTDNRRRALPDPETPAAPVKSSDENQETLECADERQLSDEDNENESGRLDTFVDDLEEGMDTADAPDPSAVNMEVASTGKVTARQEDGTRIPTPAQGSGHPAPPRQRGQPSAPTTPSARAMSYAAAIQAPPTDWHIEFSMDEQKLANDMTIYRAVHYNKDQPVELLTRNVWNSIHPIKFRKVPGPPLPSTSEFSQSKEVPQLEKGELPASLREHTTTAQILRLLDMLHKLNANLEDVMEQISQHAVVRPEPVGQFVNTKLTAKLNRQLEEPLIVASNCLPSWSEDLARIFPFLFPFETRHLFLQSTSFGYSRSMNRWQNSHATDSNSDRNRDDRPFLGRLQRQKVRISRTRILESAIKVLELYGSSPSILEVEYFEEVGTGLGPTLEFYSTVSKEFSKRKSKLWRDEDSSSKEEFAFGKHGLFPAPMSQAQVGSENGKKILHLFRMLGKFVARSMLDSRIIDVSFNPMFFKVTSDSDRATSSLSAVRAIDPGLASSLKLIKAFVTAKKAIDSNTFWSEEQRAEYRRNIHIGNASIDDLGLDFTLPGYPSIDLVENGSNLPVTIENVEEYLRAVIDLTLASGVESQLGAFRAGFSEVFPYSALSSFTPDELVMLFGRVEEDWTLETLTDSIRADHGFNMDSKSVRNLLQTMSELSSSNRRDFLQFVTGSPKLPIGGFKSLTPMFTVVCKPSEPPFTSDDYLPSVMTCVNYLKLPDYSDLEVMKSRLYTAIREGQGAFHLS